MMQARIAVCLPINDDISLAVIPAKAGIQESGDTVVKGCRFYRMARWLSFLLSCPLCGNGLAKPLDSSAFVPDTALPPASMQAGLRRNDEGLASGFAGMM